MKPEKQLYQWDINQSLVELTPSAQFVDYPIGDEVIRIKSDGTRCRIPDEILQTYGGKTCYERYPNGTYRAYSFTVLYAPKPPDYVYTAEERTTFDALVAKADAAIEEIKRRADSGEFTPKKGVDYFTEAEKNELMAGVSSGAVGEFRNVVDSATTEYNANATEKLTTYNRNAEQHTTDYNRNAEVKLEAYNSNHTAKVAEYNQNAETKTAEFDANAAALQKQMAKKANVDGYYEDMTVGDAEQLIATQFVEDNEPYTFRPTGGSHDVGNRAYLDKIVGGTVAWNQLVCSKAIGSGGTLDIDGGVYTLTPNISSGYSEVKFFNNTPYTRKSGHKYYTSIEVKSDAWASGKNSAFCVYDKLWLKDNMTMVDTSNHSWQKLKGIFANRGDAWGYGYFCFRKYHEETNSPVSIKNAVLFDLTQMLGSTIADYIYSLEQATTGAGVAWFKNMFPKDYYEYNAGELLSVEGLQSHDAVGFNQWDEEWEVGVFDNNGEPYGEATNAIRSKTFCKCVPNTTHYCRSSKTGSEYYIQVLYYDANKNFISRVYVNNRTFTTPQNARYFKICTQTSSYIYGGTYLNDICINLNSPSRNGEYEPYEKHSYPLDNSLTLRGIPKLDASNNLYYDGDEYASDGTVTRKYGVVDLGTLDWTTDLSSRFRAELSGIKNPTTVSERQDGLVCAKYPPSSSVSVTDMSDKGMLKYNGEVFIKDSTYTDVQTFKAAVSGVTLVYELATPTTETAEPFQNIQIVDDYGTEEFVSTDIVPVGHKTRYPANLRDKLQHLPSLASADGTYLIRQTGKQMSLIHTPAVFPETPTEDGTYTLKTVVTGGVATLQWVAE